MLRACGGYGEIIIIIIIIIINIRSRTMKAGLPKRLLLNTYLSITHRSKLIRMAIFEAVASLLSIFNPLH